MTIEQILEILENYKLRIPPTVFYDLKADIVNFEEPTTKNDLGVDCISRQAVIDLMMQKWGENFSGDDAMQESIDAIRELPSVTPQEPKWIPVSERLPDTDDEVLCWYEYYHWSREKVLPEYGIGCYFKETSAWYGEVASGRSVVLRRYAKNVTNG